nr:MAG TPA: hypothetical protein [Caudoviricetes sp.]
MYILSLLQYFKIYLLERRNLWLIRNKHQNL